MRHLVLLVLLIGISAGVSQKARSDEAPMSLVAAAYAEQYGHCEDKMCQVVTTIHNTGLLITFYRDLRYPTLLFTEILCNAGVAVYGGHGLNDRASFGEIQPDSNVSIDKYDTTRNIGSEHAMLWQLIYLRRLIEVSTMAEHGILFPSSLSLAEHDCRPTHINLDSSLRR